VIDGGNDGAGRPAAIDIGDAELERLAMAADPELEIDDDAVPFGTGAIESGLLPEWYMPAVQRVDRRPRRVLAVAVIVGALLVVNGAGLCVTYGLPEIAW
jgi:hypothetical protein